MADTQNIPDILINNRRGGIAESNTLMREGDCAYMENLDGRSDPSVLKLNRGLFGTFDTLSLPIAYADGYVFCEKGHVYFPGGGIAATLTGIDRLISVTKFSLSTPGYSHIVVGFYVPTTNTDIIRSFAIPYTSGALQFASTVYDYFDIYDYQTNLNGDFSILHKNWYNVHVINYEDDFLYISICNKIYVVNQPFCTPSAGRIEYYFSLESNIAGMTRSGYTINIYLNNGLKYFWQGIENRTTNGSIDLGIKRIHNVGDGKNFDYILGVGFTGQTNCIFVSQGQDIQLLKESSILYDGPSSIGKFYIDNGTYNRQWCSFNHNLSFFPVLGEDIRGGIISLGARNEVTSKARINEYMQQGADQIGMIGFGIDSNSNPYLYFGYDLGGLYKFTSLPYFNTLESSKSYQPQGVRYTKKYLSPNVKQRTATRFRFRYDKPSGTSIAVYYSIDGEDTYTLLGNLPDQKDYEGINMSRSTKPRYEIQFKIILSTTDITKTPKLYTMEVYGSNSTR